MHSFWNASKRCWIRSESHLAKYSILSEYLESFSFYKNEIRAFFLLLFRLLIISIPVQFIYIPAKFRVKNFTVIVNKGVKLKMKFWMKLF